MLLELLAVASLAVAAPAPKSTATVTLSDLVSRVQSQGEGAVVSGAMAGWLGVDDPTTCKVLHFGETADKLSHSVYVAENPSWRPGDKGVAQLVFFVTRSLTRKGDERRFFALSASGGLKSVTVVRDRFDSKGSPTQEDRDVESPAVDEEKVQGWFQREHEFYFVRRGR